MPKATKDTQKDELNKKKTTTKKASTTTKKKATKSADTNKPTVKKTKTSNSTKSTENKAKQKVVSEDKKEVKEKVTKSTTKKTSTSKKTTTTKTKKPSASKKMAVTKTKTSITTKKKKTTTSTANKRSTSKTKNIEANIVAEYYDLPYRYNETTVKILYQTPTILYVYWDISDSDRERFKNEYGENFFNNTRPILKIYNLTKKYDFEIEINDFANSWYINVNDADCQYKVELARRTIKFEEKLNTEYIYISSSNDIEFPNDRILIDKLPNKINFKNVKTNVITSKDIGTMHLVGINKIYKVHEFYKEFYKDEILEEINSKHIINPSSSSW